MLTANVFDDDVARYLAHGADGVLRKPIDTVALFSLLAQVAERRAGATINRAGSHSSNPLTPANAGTRME